MSVKNAIACSPGSKKKNEQNYFWDHSEKMDENSQMIDDNNIAYKIEVDISIFYGEYIMQSEPKTEIQDEPPPM